MLYTLVLDECEFKSAVIIIFNSGFQIRYRCYNLSAFVCVISSYPPFRKGHARLEMVTLIETLI